MAQAVSRRPLKAEAWIRFVDIPSRVCGRKKVEQKLVFVSVLWSYPVRIILHTLYIHLYLMSFVP